MKKLIGIVITLLIISVVAIRVLSPVLKKQKSESYSDDYISPPEYLPPEKLFVQGRPVVYYPFLHDSDILKVPSNYVEERFSPEEKIGFFVNNMIFRYPKKEFESLNFVWDFGDGTKVIDGVEQIHSYSEVGSYIVDVGMLVVDGIAEAAPDETQKVKPYARQIYYTDVVIHIVPTEDYELPEATLLGVINPVSVLDRQTQVIYSAQKSTGVSSLKYFIDYGDNKSTNYPLSVHTYDRKRSSTSVALRVTDEKGLLSDESLVFSTSEQVKNKQMGETRKKIVRYLDEKLNNAFNYDIDNRFHILSSVLSVGFLQNTITPFFVFIAVLYAFKKESIDKSDLFHFSYTYVILQLFFISVISLAYLYLENGHNFTDVFVKTLRILSYVLLGVIFINTLISRRGSSYSKQNDIAVLGTALGLFPLPYAFTIFLMSTNSLGMHDSLYLLTMSFVGSVIFYIVIFKIVRLFRAFSSHRPHI